MLPSNGQEVITVRNKFGFVKAITLYLVAFAIGVGVVAIATQSPVDPQEGNVQRVGRWCVLGFTGILAVVLVGYSLFFMPIKVEFAESIQLRSILRSWSIDHTDVVRIGLHRRIESIPLPLRLIFKLSGEVLIVLSNGAMVTTEVSSSEFEAIEPLVTSPKQKHLASIVPDRRTAIGQIGGGCLFLALGLYVNYLALNGEWAKLWQPAPNQPPGNSNILRIALPFALPIAGIVICYLGFRQLRSRVESDQFNEAANSDQ